MKSASSYWIRRPGLSDSIGIGYDLPDDWHNQLSLGDSVWSRTTDNETQEVDWECIADTKIIDNRLCVRLFDTIGNRVVLVDTLVCEEA